MFATLVHADLRGPEAEPNTGGRGVQGHSNAFFDDTLAALHADR